MAAIKEEVVSKVGSEHGADEMEVDSADEQREEAKGNQVQRSSNNTGATFNTLSSLNTLKPGTILQHD